MADDIKALIEEAREGVARLRRLAGAECMVDSADIKCLLDAAWVADRLADALDGVGADTERLKAERFALARLPGGPSYFASEEEHDAAWELAKRVMAESSAPSPMDELSHG